MWRYDSSITLFDVTPIQFMGNRNQVSFWAIASDLSYPTLIPLTAEAITVIGRALSNQNKLSQAF
jgi:hypothetical protein